MKNHLKLLKYHFEVQKGMYFSEYIEEEGYVYFFSDIITDAYWNYAFHVNDKEEMANDSIFNNRNRSTSYYVTSDRGNSAFLTEFTLLSEESFMTYNGGVVECPIGIQVEKVKDKIIKESFIDVFQSAYGGERTPEQPYGELNVDYVNALARSFDNEQKFHHYVCYKNERVVSVATLCLKDGIGGIYNVGTLQDERGHGYGTAVTLACIKDWYENKGKILFLQTETGSMIENWYKTLGFETVFVGKIYG